MEGILFICHGNICRSPMAEFVFQDMLEKRGLEGEFFAASAATSTEEIGNPVHPGTRRKLNACGIPLREHRAVQLTKRDYGKYALLLGMDGANIKNMFKILGADPDRKIYRLLDFSKTPRDIADPWYTGDFDATYADILEGCEALLASLMKKGKEHGTHPAP